MGWEVATIRYWCEYFSRMRYCTMRSESSTGYWYRLMMRQRWILVIFWIILGSLIGAEKPSPALACSGSMQPIESLVESADVVVKAEIVEVDDYNVNAIVRVESYLVGEAGAEYLPVTQVSQHDIWALIDGRGYCGFSAQWWHLGEKRIMFLKRYDDGSYKTLTGGWDNDYRFEDDTSTMDTVHMNDDGEYESIALTEAELRQEISEISGQSPIEPLSDAPYPLHAPSLIQTEQGSAYILPMDGAEPVLIGQNIDHLIAADRFVAIFQSDEIHYFDRQNISAPRTLEISETIDCINYDCFTFSPNGTSMVYRLTQDTIQFCSGIFGCNAYQEEEIILSGQGIKFSPQNDGFAIWNNNKLDLYRIVTRFDYDKRTDEVLDLKSATLNLDDEFSATWSRQHTVWSPDGRKLAFSDADGLWIWDVMIPETEPQLFIPAAGNSRVSIPLHFSPHGNYLAIEQDERTYTLEIVSGRELPYGIVSPDERFMAAFTNRDNIMHLEGCLLSPFECHWIEGSVQQSGTWINPYTFFGIRWCGDYCVPVLTRFPTSALRGDFTFGSDHFLWYVGTQHQTEPINDNLLVLNDATTLSVGTVWATRNEYEPTESITFHLEGQLDGDIVSVEWLPSMFLQERQ